ncbi:MAG: hypothetical protein FVQ78_03415 [Solirubrobacterales bacterium]|nr:hypothetical protein [Solirubrobacterales bacterium]
MTAEEWVEQFAKEIGADVPSKAELDQILELASVAAHASERTAAPVACWMVGRTGKSVAELIQIAERTGAA